MDSTITSASQALAAGNPLDAMNLVALRNDAPALALRGIAMAQIGDLVRAKSLLREAVRAFGPQDRVAQARCVVAETEIALATRDLGWPTKRLNAARKTLETHHDYANAALARHIELRRQLLLGQLDHVEQALSEIDTTPYPPALKASHELVIAGVRMRRLQTQSARQALVRAARYARQSGIPGLMSETEDAALVLNTPAARLITSGRERLVLLEEVEALLASRSLVIDACRYDVRFKDTIISLARRPLLFSLVRLLSEAWPNDISRDVLIEQAFRTKYADDTHRVRLRVEIGRLRKLLKELLDIEATSRGFVLVPGQDQEVAVLARPVEERHGSLLALLADGQAWSSSALAAALGTSQRTVQRALDTLATAGKVQSFGHGRTCRWLLPSIPAFTTTLLLPAPLPGD